MTLPVGYADGVPRRLSGKLRIAVQGQSFPVVGRICMDMMMVDIGERAMSLDAEVTLLGQGAQSIHDWAELSGTIPYELLTQLGRRWSRVYMQDGQISTIARPV